MSDLKISQLTDGGNSQATDEYVVARSGANYRIDGASVAAAATSVGTLSSLTVSGDLTVDTSTLKVDSTNNRVGIGTASPSFALDVSGADGVRARVLATSGGTPGLVLSSAGNTAYTIKAGNTDNSLRIDQDGTDRIILSSGGNLAVDTNTLYVDATNNWVGIGTATPEYKLHVETNSTTVQTQVRVVGGSSDTTIANNSPGAVIQLRNLNTTANTYNAIYNLDGGGNQTSGIVFQNNSDANNEGTLAFITRPASGNMTERMRIDSSGNLGLGVTPTARFGIAIPLFSDSSANGMIRFQNPNVSADSCVQSYYVTNDGSDIYIGANAYINTSGAITRFSTSYAASAINVRRDGTISLQTNSSSGNPSERARITSGGYFKASDDGTYYNSAGTYHELRATTNNPAAILTSVNASFTGNALEILTNRNTTNNTYYYLACYDLASSSFRLRIADSGNVTNVNGSYGTISDARHKQDIVDAPSQWNDLKAFKFRKFRMKSQVEADENAPYLLGVVAQELEEVSPGLVSDEPDYEDREVTDEDGNVTTERVQVGTTKTVKSSILLMKAAVALQEAMARIEALEARLEALEA